jgi:hypothetical protein
MTMGQLLGLVALVGIGAFVTFAFRQGMRVKPDDRPDRFSVQPSDLDPPR